MISLSSWTSSTALLPAIMAIVVLAVAVSFAASATSGPSTQASPPADTSKFKESRPPDKEVVFKKTPQGDLKMFAYLPGDWKKADKRPAIVFFFGGGWVKGTAQQFYSKAEYFASRGMVAFCAEYRIRDVHKTTMDKCVEDAKSAMRFVRKNAADWGVDPDRLVSSGGSSGGHLAAAVAMVSGGEDPADDLTVSCKPQAMVLFNPVVDLVGGIGGGEKLPSDRYPGSTPEERLREATKLSPTEFLKKDSPPAIFFFGTGDGLLAQSRVFVNRSAALGNRVELWTAKEMGHGFFNAAPWHQATLIKADEFLSALGYLKGSPTIKSADDKAVLDKYVAARPQTQTAPAK